MVVFDVDGTLYSQPSLRLRMGRDLIWHALSSRDFTPLTVIRRYRTLRENMGEEGSDDFERRLSNDTAAAVRLPVDTVRDIIEEWIAQRPLRHLRSCRYPGVAAVFAGLKRRSIIVSALSDYPLQEKLSVLELKADFAVHAGEKDVGVLKPNPRGLKKLLQLAGMKPGEVVVIGDRADRDGLVATAVGARALIRSNKPIQGWRTFSSYKSEVFNPILLPDS